MKRLMVLFLILYGCGGGGGSSNIGTGSHTPILEDVMIIDSLFEHAPPRIWDVGECWQFKLFFSDEDNDIDHAVGCLYDPDTDTLLWGPYVFDLLGHDTEYTNECDGGAMAEQSGLYSIGFVIVDSEGNESDEIFEMVRIRQNAG